jgi:hypothetical protein
MVRANKRTGDYAWYTTQLSAAQGAALLRSTNVSVSALVYAETVAQIFVDNAYVTTLNNEQHNGHAQNLTIASVKKLRTAANISILASCVGLSADRANTGDVGRAGVSAVFAIGAVSLATNTWQMQPSLSGGPGSYREELEAAAQSQMGRGEAGDCSFPIDRSYPIECLGMTANHAGDVSAAACEQTCCETGAECGAWQWGATASNCSKAKVSACGCWLGGNCEHSGTQGFWTGAARLPPTLPEAKPTWLRTTFDLPPGIAPADLPVALDLGAATGERKGHLFINGFDCGRFWYGKAPYTVQRFYQLPPDHLKPTGNVLVLFDELAPLGPDSKLEARIVAAA